MIIPSIRCKLSAAFAIAALSGASAFAAPATSTHDLGPVTLSAGHTTWTGVGKTALTIELTGGFTVTSTQYNANGSVARVEYVDKQVRKVTAEGSPSAGKQVTFEFTDQANASGIRFLADHAVMVPDPTADHPEQQKVTFTGNVTMFLSNRAALQEPSKSTMTKAVMYLGNGDDYPRLEADTFDLHALPAAGH